MLWVLVLAVFAGISYSLDGVAYRYAEKFAINSRQLLFPITLTSSLVFLIFAWRERASWQLIAIAVAAGASQYLLAFFYQLALRHGPLTPMWCALMLCFVPVILYAGIFLKETIGLFQVSSIVLAAVAVIAAAYSNRSEPSPSEKSRKKAGISLFYVMILLVLTGLNGFSNIALKMASALRGGEEYKGAENLYMTVFFGTSAALIFLEFLFTRKWPRFSRHLVGATLMGAGGCSVGMWLLSLVVTAPAALVFTAMNTASILSAGVLSVTLFGEKRSPAWYCMVVSAISAIVLSNLS